MSAFIVKYRKYLIGLAVAIALIFSFNLYVGKKEDAAYDKGFQSANLQWEKKGQEYVALIDKSRADNQALNDELAKISEEKRKLEEQRADRVRQSQLDYVKTPESKNKGLDDKFIEIYNQSLGE